MKNNIFTFLIQISPIFFMVSLIYFIKNDYLLTFIYLLLILFLFYLKKEKRDLLIFTCGFITMVFFEWLFVSSGVETFTRNSLLGIMPLWLPFLWAYGFVVMRRCIRILENF